MSVTVCIAGPQVDCRPAGRNRPAGFGSQRMPAPTRPVFTESSRAGPAAVSPNPPNRADVPPGTKARPNRFYYPRAGLVPAVALDWPHDPRPADLGHRRRRPLRNGLVAIARPPVRGGTPSGRRLPVAIRRDRQRPFRQLLDDLGRRRVPAEGVTGFVPLSPFLLSGGCAQAVEDAARRGRI